MTGLARELAHPRDRRQDLADAGGGPVHVLSDLLRRRVPLLDEQVIALEIASMRPTTADIACVAERTPPTTSLIEDVFCLSLKTPIAQNSRNCHVEAAARSRRCGKISVSSEPG